MNKLILALSTYVIDRAFTDIDGTKAADKLVRAIKTGDQERIVRAWQGTTVYGQKVLMDTLKIAGCESELVSIVGEWTDHPSQPTTIRHHEPMF